MDASEWAPTAENAQLVRDCVARNLLRERRRAGLTQEALANASGVGRDTIARVEAGKREPILLTLIPLTFALDVPLQALLLGLPGPDV